MKSETLYGGGKEGYEPLPIYFDGIYYRVISKGRDLVTLLCHRNSRLVLAIYINVTRKDFSVSLSKDANLTQDHLFACERLLQSSALLHGFPVTQILFPLFGVINLKKETELSGVLEIFPSIGV